MAIIFQDDFSTETPGELNGQNGWISDPGRVIINNTQEAETIDNGDELFHALSSPFVIVDGTVSFSYKTVIIGNDLVDAYYVEGVLFGDYINQTPGVGFTVNTDPVNSVQFYVDNASGYQDDFQTVDATDGDAWVWIDVINSGGTNTYNLYWNRTSTKPGTPTSTLTDNNDWSLEMSDPGIKLGYTGEDLGQCKWDDVLIETLGDPVIPKGLLPLFRPSL